MQLNFCDRVPLSKTITVYEITQVWLIVSLTTNPEAINLYIFLRKIYIFNKHKY